MKNTNLSGRKQLCEHRFINAQRLFPGHNAPLRPSFPHRLKKGRRDYLQTFTNVESRKQLHGTMFYSFLYFETLESCPDYRYLLQNLFGFVKNVTFGVCRFKASQIPSTYIQATLSADSSWGQLNIFMNPETKKFHVKEVCIVSSRQTAIYYVMYPTAHNTRKSLYGSAFFFFFFFLPIIYHTSTQECQCHAPYNEFLPLSHYALQFFVQHSQRLRNA
jgi:hypothetical protein